MRINRVQVPPTTLVVARDGEAYRGHMLLGLDTAYARARARQIARPEEWLTAK